MASSIQPSRPILLLGIVLTMLLAVANTARASGTVSFGDISIRTEPAPSISTTRGYAALPVTITNDGNAPRTVTLVMRSDGFHSSGVAVNSLRRTFEVGPNAVVRSALYVPPADLQTGTAAVLIDGVRQRNDIDVGFPGHSAPSVSWRGSSEAYGVLLSQRVPLGFVTAIDDIRRTDRFQLLRTQRAEGDISQWLGEWLAYTRYTAIVVTAEEWRSAPAAVRDAIATAVRAGGTLVVLADSLAFDHLEGLGIERSPGPQDELTRSAMAGVAPLLKPLGFGFVATISPNTSAMNRASVLTSILTESIRASQFGETDTLSDAESRLQVAPDETLPVGGVMLILAFVALILGPANFIVMARLKRRPLLFVTTPTLALLFSGVVFAFGLFHDGTGVRVRSLSVTLLDQQASRATTFGQWGCFAPVPPPGGVSIAGDTLAWPVGTSYREWSDTAAVSYDLDQTDRFVFSGGLVRSRVPCHIMLRRDTVRRERVLLEREGDAWFATNGLGAGIERMLVSPEPGKVFVVTDLAAGARVALSESPSATNRAAISHHAAVATAGRAISAIRSIERRNVWDPGPGRYVALLETDPFLDVTVAREVSRDAQALVYGLLE